MMPVDAETSWSVEFPAEALAAGSVSIRPRGENSDVNDLFTCMQKIAQYWEHRGSNNYLIYANSRETGWEMVPYVGSRESTWDIISSFFRQVEVLSRVVWGRAAQVEDPVQAQAIVNFQTAIPSGGIVVKGSDVFCNKQVTGKQQIVKDKNIRVLHDYAPLGEDKLHFLLVPKAHKERFTELSFAEFQSMQAMAQKIVALYPDYICYQYFKTGKLAGQTVPHFHHHLVFVKPQNEWQGQLAVFMRMICPPTPLPAKELADRVQAVKTLLEGSDKLRDTL